MEEPTGGKRGAERAGEEETRPAKRPRASPAGAAPGGGSAGKPWVPGHSGRGPQGAAAQATAAEADEHKRQQLLDALAAFAQHRRERQLFLEVDVVAEVGPEGLVGRQVRVLWPGDEAWYLGTVTSYSRQTGRHEVDYADGDHGSELLAVERVRLLLHAGEALPGAAPESLTKYASCLLEQAGKSKQAGALRAKAQQLQDLAERRRAEAQQQAEAEAQQQAEAATQQAEAAAASRAEADQRASVAAPAEEVQHNSEQSSAQGAALRTEQGEAPQGPRREAQVEQQEAPQKEQRGAPQEVQQAQREAQQEQQEPNTKAGQGEGGGQAQPLPQPGQKLHETQQSQRRSRQQRAAVAAAGAVLLPGEVVWGRVTGYRDWPALVITREEAVGRGMSSTHVRSAHSTPVMFFGTAEVACLRSAAVTPFEAGVRQRFHSSKAGRKELAFRRSLCEVETYLQVGELPPCMLPNHNDGHGTTSDSEEEDGSAGKGRAGSKARSGGGKKAVCKPGQAAAGVAVQLPFRPNKHITVLSLGRIEWIHPGFHDEKHIWPVGYQAERLAATPASQGHEVPHLCQVLEAPDGSGPLFRVTPKGGQPVEAATPLLAWQALYAGDKHGRVRTMGISGPAMFGLTSPRVVALIQQLPGAARCERYCGWPEGEQPEVPPLAAAEQRARLACSARMQKLPPEVRPVPLDDPWAGSAAAQRAQQQQQGGAAPRLTGTGACRGAVCQVCMSEEEEGDDFILQCDGCRALVHVSCYGVERNPCGDLWLCDVCNLGLDRSPACVLCPVVGGLMKPTACGRWCHSACGLWTEETRLDPARGVIQGVQQVNSARLKLSCRVCGQQYGSCIQCAGSKKCYASFHPLCAWGAGFPMELVVDYDSSDSEGEGDSGDENDASLPNHPAPSSKPARRRGKAKEGTGLGNGMRLVAHCPRHPPAQRLHLPRRPPPLHAPPGATSGTAVAAAAGPCEVLARQGSSLPLRRPLADSASRVASSAALPSAAAAAAAPAGGCAVQSLKALQQQCPGSGGERAPLLVPGTAPAHPPSLNPHGCARAAPLNQAARRGQLAPEALAAAEAKRLFVRSVPYIVGGPRQQHPDEVPASTLREPPQQPVTARQEQQERQQGGAAAAAAGGGEATVEQQQDGPGHGEQMADPALPPAELLLRPNGERILSQCDRFREMRRTVGRRITIGKSGIHGWGAFAKRRHSAGDMVIEYAGEVVRHSVSDVRERRVYNDLVGAGTYVFSLHDHLNVDATRAGNMAHILNHSCAPNCFSRIVSLRLSAEGAGADSGVEGGRVEDHVVIFALKDIEVGEELCYDYRFSGEEQLPCNCGAPSCRGLVNKRSSKREGLWVPRHKLKPYFPAGFQAAKEGGA